MSGFLTNQRLWGCTTFVDHVSDYVYVHLMRDIGLEETLLAKTAWEKVLSQAGRQVKHYHADNVYSPTMASSMQSIRKIKRSRFVA